MEHPAGLQSSESTKPGPALPSSPRVVIAVAFGGFGTWAALAPLDSAAIAPGVVVVEGNRKTIQHLEGGIVKEISVRDGDRVEQGDLLLRLDDTRARALHDILRGELNAAQALAARLGAEHALAGAQ